MSGKLTENKRQYFDDSLPEGWGVMDVKELPVLSFSDCAVYEAERAVISAALAYREAEKLYDRQPVSITHSFEFKTTLRGAGLLTALGRASDGLIEAMKK